MELHLVVPESVADPRRPSGGNVYDAELARALEAGGVRVGQHTAPLALALDRLPDDAVVLVDGLVGSAEPEVLAAVRQRLCVLLLVHLPLGVADPAARAAEQRALDAVAGVVTTSGWTRDWLTGTYDIDPARVAVARPGVHPAPLAPRGTGRALLCVGAVQPAKGQDVLVEALATLRDLAWRCRLVGPLDRDPAFVRELQQRVRELGLERRVLLRGPVPHARITTEYSAADLLVQPTRLETYGMTVTEALAHGVPVVAADVGGAGEALGVGGVLVPPDDPGALALALRRWLTDPAWCERLRAAAVDRRAGLERWSATARAVLDAVAVQA